MSDRLMIDTQVLANTIRQTAGMVKGLRGEVDRTFEPAGSAWGEA